MMPVAHDALTARLAEKAGFKLICSAGYANSASLIGMPDIELLTLTEMVEAAARMCQAVSIPVFADGDTGHGGPLNVMRTVRLHERAGCCGLFIEDQVSPKRCGHMAGKQVVQAEEMLSRLGAALDAREDRDFAIMARTDARAVEGLDAAIDRAKRYRRAGADITFVEAPLSEVELARIPREVGGVCMANMIPGGRTPLLPAKQLHRMGYKMVAYPTVLTYAVAKAAQRALEALAREEMPPSDGSLMEFQEFNRLLGLEELRELEKR
jgi:methylisocitrate lyase